MSSQSSSSSVAQLRGVSSKAPATTTTKTTATTSNKRRRRLRRPGPPDRLSWLGDTTTTTTATNNNSMVDATTTTSGFASITNNISLSMDAAPSRENNLSVISCLQKDAASATAATMTAEHDAINARMGLTKQAEHYNANGNDTHTEPLNSVASGAIAIDLTVLDDGDSDGHFSHVKEPLVCNEKSIVQSFHDNGHYKSKMTMDDKRRQHDNNIDENNDNKEASTTSWECRQCTLLNPIHQSICEACNARCESLRKHRGSDDSIRDFSGRLSNRRGSEKHAAVSSASGSFVNKLRFKRSNNAGAKNNDSDDYFDGGQNITYARNSSKEASDVILPRERNDGNDAKYSSSARHPKGSNRSASITKESFHPRNRASSSQSTNQASSKHNSLQSLKKSKRSNSKGGKQSTTLKVPPCSELWTVKHAPQNSSQLCVAPKKVEEVRQWLSSYASSWQSRRQSERNRYETQYGTQHLTPQVKMMILVGSPGIGKSAMIDVLSKELKLEVLTWNDSQVDYNMDNNRYDHGNMTIPYQSQLASFEEFLSSGGVGMESLEMSSLPMEEGNDTARGGRHEGLEKDKISEPHGSLILIEEIPNLYNADTANAFRNIMERHILRARVPTVFVFSDVYEGKHRPEDLERLIPSNVIYSSMVQIIPIQPVTKSKMKKNLESIVKAEGMGRLPSEAYEELHLSGGGDLRHAIFALQFRYGSLGIVNSSSKTKSESSNADNVAKRDVKLSSFHALGKLMYAKRSPRGQDPYSTTAQLMPGVKMWDDGRGPLNFVPEIVLESTDMPTNAALSFVAHHSPDFFTDITDLSQAFDRISDAGMFIDKFRGLSQGDGPFPMDYASSIGGRAVPDANKHPAPHQFRQFSAPKVFDVMKKKRSNEVKMEQLRKRLSMGNQEIAVNDNIGSAHQFVTDCLPYMRSILPQEINHALDNLHSYANDSIKKVPNDMLAQNEPYRENDVLLDDDLVDDDSFGDEKRNE